MSRRNLDGDGSSQDAADRRALVAQYRGGDGSRTSTANGSGGPCPECGKPKRTAESLRVHRWLAHGVKVAA